MRGRSLFLCCVAVALSACGERAAVRPAAPQPSRPSQPSQCRPGYEPLRSARLAYAAIVTRHAAAVRRPGGRRLASFGRLNVNGVPTVLGVLGVRRGRTCDAAWYRVQLPVRPNGTTGWIAARAVAVAPVRTRVLVDLSARRLALYRKGRRVLSSAVAVGSPATPTPTGRYYVNQRLIPADPAGPFGPGAVGISAFSNVLTGWAQGGPIAIHGTNEPWSIGHAVSNGCIRVPNPILRRIFAAAVAGTPVVVRR